MISSFSGEFRFLSNFYEAPLLFDGRRYRNSEGAYQAAKFIEEKQMDISPWQFEELTGAEAKKLARSQHGFIRPDWKEVSLGVMIEVVHAKFTQNYGIRTWLVATFPHELIEGNTWHDYFYGVCSGKGENWLGRILMAERAYWLEIAKNGYREGEH